MRRYFLAFTAIGLAALSLPLTGCSRGGRGSETAQLVQVPEGPRLVLAPSDVVNWQDVSAEITTTNQAHVIARIAGILTVITVKEGNMVNKGQPIGRIVDDQLSYQAQAASAQAAQAQAELDRVRFLYKNGVYAKAKLEQAEAMAATSRAQTSAVRAVASQGRVVAPAGGRVLRTDVPAGSPVAPGMTIATITAGPTIVRLEAPESLADRVHVGSHVTARDIGDGTGVGTVIKIYPSVIAGQVLMDVTMPDIDNRLIGRRVAAKVDTGTRKALLVPTGYITNRYGIDYVTILEKDGSTAQVPVQTTAAAESGKLEILSGAASGDTLIATTSGQLNGAQRR